MSSASKPIDLDEEIGGITNMILFKHEWNFGGELTATAYRQNKDGTLTPLLDAIKQLLRNYTDSIVPEKRDMADMRGLGQIGNEGYKDAIDTIRENSRKLLGESDD